MEKGRPHTPLTVVRILVLAGRVRTTRSAREGAFAVGMNLDDMLEVIGALAPTDFHKSMTTHADHTIWQDVYRPRTRFGLLYVKLTVVEDLLVVSFKEL